MEKRDLLSLRDLSREEMDHLFSLSHKLKREQGKRSSRRLLDGKTLALVFEKPSLRTRVTFETGMLQLGGQAVYLGPQEISLGVRETPADCARNLSRWVDLIVVRTSAQETLEEMARYATVPVINGLTDLFHPCQVLADCFTLLERKGKLEGLKIAFVGDGNNMAHSWIQAAEKLSFSFSLACPEGYEPNAEILSAAKENGGRVLVTHRVEEAVQGADVIYTDVWTSMGQEEELETRRKAFRGYQVSEDVVARADKDVVVMHCQPKKMPEIERYIRFFFEECGIHIKLDKDTRKKLDALRYLRNRYIHQITRMIPDNIKKELEDMLTEIIKAETLNRSYVEEAFDLIGKLASDLEHEYWQRFDG